MNRLRTALTSALVTALLLATANAAPRDGQPPALLLAQGGERVTLEEAAASVRAETGGRILSAETRGRGADRVHRIKVLTGDNRVRIIEVDPRSGSRR
ncbi:PepSY domain-containing protein [Ectothiorhodospiraceae bacterium WFHF3C12]|nr:PepSY domain-containing protein [Ectothiorhodospiraceae bacterium WFHF3C12]